MAPLSDSMSGASAETLTLSVICPRVSSMLTVVVVPVSSTSPERVNRLKPESSQESSY